MRRSKKRKGDGGKGSVSMVEARRILRHRGRGASIYRPSGGGKRSVRPNNALQMQSTRRISRRHSSILPWDERVLLSIKILILLAARLRSKAYPLHRVLK
jgi:hypothetical protein